ncbi:PrsW family intramembrane metalloprotease [bacterium]|nr:PrsW family intramembrane metalloprotease [bacterium]
MLDVGTGNWLAGMAAAILPVPIYLALALWLDRFEPEPGWMLALTFFWGAIVAGLFASFFNTMGGLLVAAAAGETAGTLFSLVISAPLVEETAKGVAILILFLWKRNEFDNVTDGVIYAAMAGLGFAMTENALYYGRQFASGGGGRHALALRQSRGICPLPAPGLHRHDRRRPGNRREYITGLAEMVSPSGRLYPCGKPARGLEFPGHPGRSRFRAGCA